jgi:hypothetical protein
VCRINYWGVISEVFDVTGQLLNEFIDFTKFGRKKWECIGIIFISQENPLFRWMRDVLRNIFVKLVRLKCTSIS